MTAETTPPLRPSGESVAGADEPTVSERRAEGAGGAPAAAALSPKPVAAAPGGVVGVLGGGQLGRMLALAAARLGLKTHVYATDATDPAIQVADRATRGSEDYHRGLSAFAKDCDVVTLEFENVPLSALDTAAQLAPVRPGRRALEVSQDRIAEKQWLRSVGVETTEFVAVEGLADLREAVIALGGSGFLKTRRMGYDGKGQARIRCSGPEEADAAARAAFETIGRRPAILEAAAAFTREISVIVARGVDGEIAAYDPAENEHRDGVLFRSTVDGRIPAEIADRAQAIAARIVDKLDYVGVMGVEFFEMPQGRLLVNEIAPRVHNSGHWTLEACTVSQFEQHIRAVCGWPLGAPTRHSDAVMTNLIGDDVLDWRSLAANPGAAIHLYGKTAPRPGRKMGHVTRLLGPRL
ncbi:MAG: 5-(carboxyamino)imidazole ribonucleotide synthase [Pseudomonadota bacterium]